MQHDLAARRGYHHGHLKEALVSAARTLIQERGPQGFTLVEAARLAGVSASAPYRHFADRRALLGALAQTGFNALADRLRTAWSEGRPDAQQAFGRMGSAYLAFAMEEPGYYAAMFASGLPEDEELRAASAAAFDLLSRAVADVAAAGAEDEEGLRLALEVWSLTHGVASLAASGALAMAAPQVSANDVLRDGVRALVEAVEGRSK